ncbi:hypothetical protein [Pseudonocardia oceani]|nr:hypothetical protein [Pseudonocardia oceani]
MVRTERDGHTVLCRSALHPVNDLLDRVVDSAGPDHEDAPR